MSGVTSTYHAQLVDDLLGTAVFSGVGYIASQGINIVVRILKSGTKSDLIDPKTGALFGALYDLFDKFVTNPAFKKVEREKHHTYVVLKGLTNIGLATLATDGIARLTPQIQSIDLAVGATVALTTIALYKLFLHYIHEWERRHI